MNERVYWDDSIVNVIVDGTSYSYQVGYAPEKNEYIASATKHPKFCFRDSSREKVEEIAKSALKFYNKHGLKELYEQNDKL